MWYPPDTCMAPLSGTVNCGYADRPAVAQGRCLRKLSKSVRAPERFSFHPAVNIGSPPIAHILGAMKSSCDPRSQAQVVRSKQPAYSLAPPAVCMTVSRINQPLARWSVNYRVAFLNRLGTQRNWATLPLTQISDYSLMQHGLISVAPT